MRFFLVSYTGQGSVDRASNAMRMGCLWFGLETFPALRWIKKQCSIAHKMSGVIVLNIFEFKNAEDFDAFCSEQIEDQRANNKEEGDDY